jgi:hypothetical protein
MTVPGTNTSRGHRGSDAEPDHRPVTRTASGNARRPVLPRAAGFAGAYRVLTALAGPGQRAGLVAAIWVVFYLAFSVPVVAAGVATTHFGLHQTAVVYSASLAVFAAAAAGSLIIRRRSAPARQALHRRPCGHRGRPYGRGRFLAFVRGTWRAGAGEHVA